VSAWNPELEKYLLEKFQGDVPPSWQAGDSAVQEAPPPAPPPVNVLDYFKAMRPELFSQETLAGAEERDAATNRDRDIGRNFARSTGFFTGRSPDYAGLENTQDAVRSLAKQQEQAFRSADVGSKVGAYQSQQAMGDPTSEVSRKAWVRHAALYGQDFTSLFPRGASANEIAAWVGDKKGVTGVRETESKTRQADTAADKNVFEVQEGKELLPEKKRKQTVDITDTQAATGLKNAQTKEVLAKTDTIPGQAAATAKGKVTEGEASLRKELAGTQQAKDLSVVKPLYDIVMSTAPTGQGDMSMIYAFMKIVDPTSSVRETEYANAENAAGIPQRIRIAWNKALDGEKLEPSVREGFRSEATNIYKKRLDAYRVVEKSYTGLATGQGADPARVALDLGYKDPGGQASPHAAALSQLQPGERLFIVNGRYQAFGQNEAPPAGAQEVK
jgi:hypothetical protein